MSEINKALIKFQSEMKPVPKDSENPHFRSTFADLSSILVMVLPLLTKNKLGLLQLVRIDAGVNILVTRVFHEAGEFVESSVIIPTQNDPQKLGSLITYLKRYSLQAMLGIATEDDDGNGAAGAPTFAGKPIGNDPGPSEKQIVMIKMLGEQKGQTGTIPKTGKEASDLIAKLLKMPDAR